MKKIIKNTKLFFFATMFLASQTVQAQVLDSSFYQWSVYELESGDEDGKKCYIVNYPVKSSSDHNPRQRPYIMITRFAKDRLEEVSVSSGFEFKLNSNVFMLIDNRQHQLIAKKDLAWALTRQEDVRMIQTMLTGSTVKIRSDSAVGTYAVDEYSLKGVTAAYLRLREICK